MASLVNIWKTKRMEAFLFYVRVVTNYLLIVKFDCVLKFQDRFF